MRILKFKDRNMRELIEQDSRRQQMRLRTKSLCLDLKRGTTSFSETESISKYVSGQGWNGEKFVMSSPT